MTSPSRNFFTLFTDDLAKSRDWYASLLGYRVEFDSDWFVQLQAPNQPAVELGLLARNHALVPPRFRNQPAGGMLTVVVDDVDAVFELARGRNEQIVEEPTNQFYGQRRMLLLDPNGSLVDVSSECPPDPAWLQTLK